MGSGGILNSVNLPKDLKHLSLDELNILCAEIREKIIEVVSKGYLYKERIIKPAMVKVSE